MTAQGKITAARLHIGDRILLKRTGDKLLPSPRLTGADVITARVTADPAGKATRPLTIKTSAGEVLAVPHQTFTLAPETRAAINRAHAEANAMQPAPAEPAASQRAAARASGPALLVWYRVSGGHYVGEDLTGEQPVAVYEVRREIGSNDNRWSLRRFGTTSPISTHRLLTSARKRGTDLYAAEQQQYAECDGERMQATLGRPRPHAGAVRTYAFYSNDERARLCEAHGDMYGDLARVVPDEPAEAPHGRQACPAGEACSGAAFPGHPAHPVALPTPAGRPTPVEAIVAYYGETRAWPSASQVVRRGADLDELHRAEARGEVERAEDFTRGYSVLRLPVPNPEQPLAVGDVVTVDPLRRSRQFDVIAVDDIDGALVRVAPRNPIVNDDHPDAPQDGPRWVSRTYTHRVPAALVEPVADDDQADEPEAPAQRYTARSCCASTVGDVHLRTCDTPEAAEQWKPRRAELRPAPAAGPVQPAGVADELRALAGPALNRSTVMVAPGELRALGDRLAAVAAELRELAKIPSDASALRDVRLALVQRGKLRALADQLDGTAPQVRLTDATGLDLVDHIDDRTGASVGMWRNTNTAPVEWGAVLAGRAGSDPWERTPYVGEGADGARRSAQIDRNLADALPAESDRRAELIASADMWDDQANAIEAATSPAGAEAQSPRYDGEGPQLDEQPAGEVLADLLDAGGYLSCGCHGSQRDHTCGPREYLEPEDRGAYLRPGE